MAALGTSPPRPAAVALRAGGEAAQVSGVTEEVGGGEDVRQVEPVAAVRQGRLRETAGDGGGHDLRGDELDNAAQAGTSGMRVLCSYRSPPFTVCKNSL